LSQELIEFHANIGKQWFTNPSLATAHWIVSQGEKRSLFAYPYNTKRPPRLHRIAIFRSWTVEPVAILMQAIGLVHNIALNIYYGGWGQHAQDILCESNWLHKSNFDAVILTAENDNSFGNLVTAFQNRYDIPLLVHPYEKHRDLDGVPFHADELLSIAQAWMRDLYPLVKTPSKVLVMDLDNTLWQGVLGEDGFKGITLDQSLQHALLDLYTQGVILAVCSKNSEREALDVLWNHLHVLTRPNRLATWRINWQDKATNLCEIAEELNVGLDSLVFFDDSPIERGWVHSQLPEVIVPELPDDPALYASVLKQGLWFERGTLTEEDKHRGEYYAQQRQHKEAQATMTLEDYYWSLEQKVEIRQMTAETLPRVVQLFQKTNQFNLTTKRYTKQELIHMSNGEWKVFTLRAKDKFGDNGIVGVAILHFCGDACEIYSFLLSCRAIGRTIETAFLSWLTKHAKSSGAIWLYGWYYPTERNAPCADFYARHGFDYVDATPIHTTWAKVIPGKIEFPAWITYE
jgi:FkbH-like protein